MSEPSRYGAFHVVFLRDEWHVLFEPDDLERLFLSIARFNSKERAASYASIEQVANDHLEGTCPDEFNAVKPIPYPSSPPPVRLDIPKTDGNYADPMQGGAEAARLAHNQKAEGSSPSPATKTHQERSGTAREAPSTRGERGPVEPLVEAAEPDVGVKPAAASPHLSSADKGGPHELAPTGDCTETQVERPVRECPRPVAADLELPPEQTDPKFVILSDRQHQLLAYLQEMARPDGRVFLSVAAMSEGSGVPRGSIPASLDGLERKQIIQPRKIGSGKPIQLTPNWHKTPESREDVGASPAAPSEAPPQEHGPDPARETAAPESQAKADDDVSRDMTGRAPDAARPVPDETESVSRLAGGRTPAATSERMDVTSSGGEQPGTRLPPKPEWDFGRGRAIAKAEAPGAPHGLAIAGAYLILDEHHIRLPDHAATIMRRLVKEWGSPVPKSDLIADLMSYMHVREADKYLELKKLGDLNTLLKPAGLVVFEVKGCWRLEARQEAGVPA